MDGFRSTRHEWGPVKQGRPRLVQLLESGIPSIHRIESPEHFHYAAISTEDVFDVLLELFIASERFFVCLSPSTEIHHDGGTKFGVHDSVLPHFGPRRKGKI
jgi:hypothetical protein